MYMYMPLAAFLGNLCSKIPLEQLRVAPVQVDLAPVSFVILRRHGERFPRPVSMYAYISARCTHLSQCCVTSIDALSNPGKRARE